MRRLFYVLLVALLLGGVVVWPSLTIHSTVNEVTSDRGTDNTAGLPKGNLPTLGTARPIAQVTDTVRRLQMDQGSQWFALSGEVANAKEFGAVGDGVVDDTAAVQAAIDQAEATNGVVFIPAGTYKITTTLTGGVFKGIVIAGAGAAKTILKGTGKGAGLTLFQTQSRHSILRDLQLSDASVCVQAGTAGDSAGQWSFYNLFFQNCTTGMKVVQSNLSRIFGGFMEGCDTGLHFTVDTVNTNAWTVMGLQINTSTDGVLIESKDHYINVVTTQYTNAGVRLLGVSTAFRNIIVLYAETTMGGTAYIAVGSSNQLFGRFLSTPATSGTVNGIIANPPPVQHQNGQVQFATSTLDVTAASKTDQSVGQEALITGVNTGGTTRDIDLQKLDVRLIGGSQYYYIPSTNTATVRLELQHPASFTYQDGTTIKSYASGTDRFIKLTKISSNEFFIMELQ